MLRKIVYPKIEAILNKSATVLDKQGFTPNQLTLAGLGLNFLAGCVYASGSVFLGGIVLIIASLMDMFDGPLARVSQKASRFGAFLDSSVDRYSDFFVYAGLVLFFARHGQGLWVLVCLGIIMGSFLTSYTKARAECIIDNCSVGIFERAERVIALALASLIWPLLPVMLWVLLIGTNFTAIQRILHVYKILEQKKKTADPEDTP